MTSKKDFTGIKRGSLTYLKSTEHRKHSGIMWEASCDCGKTIIVLPNTSRACSDPIHRTKRKPEDNVYKCSRCNSIKPINEFRFTDKKNNIRRPECKECSRIDGRKFLPNSREYKRANKNAINRRRKQLDIENPQRVINRRQKARDRYSHDKEYREKLKEYKRKYRANNLEKIRANGRERYKRTRSKSLDYEKKRRKTDVAYTIRRNISSAISRTLKSNGSGKGGTSFEKKIGYKIKNDLIPHLERLFEPWMTWKNYGAYNANTWNDNDPSTWTWQVDHIKPQSDYSYDSMNHSNFKICWALENLRPLSSKQNLIDGSNRTRHKKPC